MTMNAWNFINRPQRCTGQTLWHCEYLPDSDPGWEGLYYLNMLIAEIYPHPRFAGTWQWVVWLGAPSGGHTQTFAEARAKINQDLAKRPASEVEAALATEHSMGN